MYASPPVFHIRKCENPACGLRYSLLESERMRTTCPRCHSSTQLILTHQGTQDWPEQTPTESTPHQLRLPFEALLDNLRSAWNVGSIFRSADAAGLSRLYLCGITPTPLYPAVLKTSLGAEKRLEWRQHNDAVETALQLRQNGRQLWALETVAEADVLYQVTLPRQATGIVLVVGNELAGIDPGLLALCARCLRIPMLGFKRSLNVAVAFGVAAHYLAWVAARST